MAPQTVSTTLTGRRASALLSEINGSPSLLAHCTQELDRAINWLETVASEPVQRGPDALSPQSAAALLDAVRCQTSPNLYEKEAWLGLAWIERHSKTCAL